ncbi:MAG TPA: hypothetical protein VJZ76_18590 [Thermoanaerobaculia bacterium]|nr:hypothetical protein [Thermoanaerobaculia bacterium]
MLNRGRLLLGAFYDCERAVDFAVRVAVVDVDDVRRRWRAAREAFLASPAPPPVAPEALDETARAEVEEILAAPLFRTALDGKPWSLAAVDALSVATLQPVVNLGRVAVMRERLAASALLPILFPSTTELDVEPETGGGPTVSFLSSRGELAVSGAQIHRATDTAPIELTFRIEPRPNYVSVLAADDRLVLRNGHHRLLAACAGGARTLPMVVVEGSVDALAAHIDGLPPRTGVRAAMLADFLEPSAAALDVELRPKRYALRLRVERETLYAA